MNAPAPQSCAPLCDATSALRWRILLASGSSIEQKYVVGLLSKHGHHVAVANTSAAAVQNVAAENWDAVLVDSWLADEDGSQLCRVIRDRQLSGQRRAAVLMMADYAGWQELPPESGIDGILRKPLRVEELSDFLTRSRQGEGSYPPARGIVDWRDVLESLGGERELLTELVAIFFEEYPPTLAEIRLAIARLDAKALQLYAHKLKGCLRYFGMTPAAESARRLEDIGRQLQLNEAPAELQRLETEIECLLPALRTWPRS